MGSRGPLQWRCLRRLCSMVPGSLNCREMDVEMQNQVKNPVCGFVKYFRKILSGPHFISLSTTQ
jgi:hypothetical protein